MTWRRSRVLWLSLTGIVLVVLAALSVAVLAQEPDRDPAAKIESVLLEELSTEGSADFIVRFAEQANLSRAYRMNWQDRGEFVYSRLREVAQRSQARAQEYLDSRGLAHHTFIAGNELYVWAGDVTAVQALAELREVDSIRATRTYSVDPIVEEVPSVPEVPNALAWGITDTHADQFWSAYGVQGDGIVVANIDTGVQWDHPALDQTYRCPSNPGSAACWWDPSDICPGDLPCDNNGHGTHTMGTMVADDDPSLTWQAGMAPNAQWIACKGCESDSCSDFALNNCSDWILAPAGSAANRPHVVNNSWGGYGCENWYQARVQAWRAAGIFPAFSAGNNTGCSSMGSPGDYQESFASTGHDITRGHAFSQGPSCYGHEPYTKPNLSAPGVYVCSTVPGSGWSCGYSGTSMASPHSAGAVALLWSCNPALVGQIDDTFQVLQNTADPPDPANPGCGVPPDGEGTYEDGYGYLNVLAAGAQACLPSATATPTSTPTATATAPPPFTPTAYSHLPLVPVDTGATRTPTATPTATSTPVQAPGIGNGGFEMGPVIWTEFSTHGWDLIINSGFPPGVTPHGGSWAVWSGGDDNELSYVQQQVTVPGGSPYLHYWHWIASQDICGYDYGRVWINGAVVDQYDLCSSANTGGWVLHSVNLAAYAGQSVQLRIGSQTDSSLNSNLFIDDVSFATFGQSGDAPAFIPNPESAAPKAP